VGVWQNTLLKSKSKESGITSILLFAQSAHVPKRAKTGTRHHYFLIPHYWEQQNKKKTLLEW